MQVRLQKGFHLFAALLMLMTAIFTSAGVKAWAATSTATKPLQKLTIQLKWLPQAQFAGIYVAQAKGFFKKEGIDPVIIPGGPDMVGY